MQDANIKERNELTKKKILRFSSFVLVILCLITGFDIKSLAVNSQPNATVESISIYNQSGVLKAEK